MHQLFCKEKSNAPEPDTKTPKNKQGAKSGERVPPTRNASQNYSVDKPGFGCEAERC